MSSKLKLMLTGAAMGIAEVIPGVSGGTIAFISGIYEQLLKSIKSFGPEALAAYKNGGIKEMWKAVDGNFLAYLFGGMGLGLVFGIFVISNLLETNPEMLWGFFFGLILVSCFLIGRQIESWNLKTIAAILLGAIIAFWITVTVPAEGSLNPIYLFLSAILAVSALMLPGISGSFVLLLLGVYTLFIPKLKNFLSGPNIEDFILISIFAAGMVLGLAMFSRVLTWIFDRYKNVALALLTGFMIGSLNKIWPWRNVSKVVEKETGKVLDTSLIPDFFDMDMETFKILSEVNVFPQNYLHGDPKTIGVIIAMLSGVAIIFIIEKLNK